MNIQATPKASRFVNHWILLSRIIQRARRHENSGAVSPLNKTSFGLREAVIHPLRGNVLVKIPRAVLRDIGSVLTR